MNDIDFKKKIEERLAELPEPLSLAIKESNWEKSVFDIGRKYDLQVDDIGNLQNELILVLTGIVHPDEFKKVIINEIGVDIEKAENIINDINQEVNQKIKDRIRKYFDEHQEDDLEDTKTEPKTIKIAGVTMGDNLDDDNEEITENEIKKDTQPEEEIVPIKEEKTVTEEKPVSVDSSKPVSGVFQTQTKTISSENNKNLDPYREPIE